MIVKIKKITVYDTQGNEHNYNVPLKSEYDKIGTRIYKSRVLNRDQKVNLLTELTKNLNF